MEYNRRITNKTELVEGTKMNLELLGKIGLMVLGVVALYGASDALLMQSSSMYSSSTQQSGNLIVGFISVAASGFCFFLAKMSGSVKQEDRRYLKTSLS